jgi:hypothetical protein
VTGLRPQERVAARRPAVSLARFIEPSLLILLGGAGVADGWRIVATKAETPGGVETGGWIAALGALLVVGAGIHLARDGGRERPSETPAEPDGLFKPPAIALVLLLLYVALMPPLGYVLATALFVAAYLRIFGRYRSLTIAAIAIPFAAGSGWLWSALNMTLPQGVLPWP